MDTNVDMKSAASQRPFGIRPAVKWLFFAGSMIQVAYFIFWLLIQLQVFGGKSLSFTIETNAIVRMLLIVLGAILLFSTSIWQVKLSGVAMALNRIAILSMVFPSILPDHPILEAIPDIFFFVVIVSDLLMLTSWQVRKNALYPLIGLIVMDLVSLYIRLFHVSFNDLMLFWTYSVLMSGLTGVLLLFFYQRLERPKFVENTEKLQSPSPDEESR